MSDVEEKTLSEMVSSGAFQARQDGLHEADFDTVRICVPTPLRKTRDPDLSHVLQAAEQLADHLRPGTLVVLESTTYPGTTEEVILPMLKGSGLKVGEDFFLSYSPERVDPGNRDYHTSNIPKVIAANIARQDGAKLQFREQQHGSHNRQPERVASHARR